MIAIDALDLVRTASRLVRERGKHALPDRLLDALVRLRGVEDPFVAALLDCLLDKRDGRFHNRTYLALALMEQIRRDPACGLDPEGMAALLMADVIRFETQASAQPPGPDGCPVSRPGPRTLRTRLAHARRFVTACGVPDGAALPEPAPAVEEWFAMTAQPVSVVHDEYFFLRALQCHEMVFTGLDERVRAATVALRAGDVAAAAAHASAAASGVERAALLFRVVATMRAEAFHTFRAFTEGASAIQSEAYKRFEIACGRPRAERLHSDAFTNVPRVQAEVSTDADDLTAAYLDARPTRGPAWDQLDAALTALEDRHQRWKLAHHGLAARMLGTAHGSGYTAGVPYLHSCLGHRLFWGLQDAS